MAARSRSSPVYRSANRRARVAWWFSPPRGSQLFTLYLSESCTRAMKRSSSLRSPVSPQRSIVSSRSATWAPTVPSGWPRRGFPQASPRSSTGSSSRVRSRSVSPATLLDALGNPEIALSGEDDSRLVAALAHGHEMGTVLVDARLVVDQDQEKVPRRPVRPHLGEGGASGLFHHLALPAAIGRRGVRERGVGGADALLPATRAHAVTPLHAEKAEHDGDQDDHAEDDQDDCQCGHAGRSLGTPRKRRRPPLGRPSELCSRRTAATYSPRAARPKYHRR